MAKKQTYAKVMKDLTSKKAKYEAGLEEAKRLGSASGIADYERRLTKLNAGMDQLFQAQEMSKKPAGGTAKFDQGGVTTTRGGWTVYTMPNDGSYPGAFVNSQGQYVMMANKDGRVAPLTEEMAQQLDGDNPRHLHFKLDQGDYDSYFDNVPSADNPNVNPNASAYGDLGLTDMPATSSEMPMDLQEEMGYADPFATAPEFTMTQVPAAPTPTGTAGVDYGMPNNLGTTGTPTFTGVNMIPEAEVAATPSAPAGPVMVETPKPGTLAPLKTLGLQTQAAGPNTGGLMAPSQNIGAELTGAPSLRSRIEDKAMDIAGIGQKIGGMNPMTKQKLGMGLGAAAQFLPDIAAMRAMDDIQGPEALPFERLQLMNADVQVGNQLNQIDQASARAMAAADRNVSNPAVAAAMKRANQRIAAGQKANVLSQEAEMESKMRNQNMMLANENMNRNRMLDYQNRQATVDFENQKLAAKNRMRQQMGMKLGQVFGDFQNLNADANKFNLLSKMYDPSLLERNGINMATMLGYTNNDND